MGDLRNFYCLIKIIYSVCYKSEFMNKFKAFLQDSISTIVKIFLAIVVAVILYVFIQQIL